MKNSINQAGIVEVTTFNLLEGVNTTDFIHAAEHMQTAFLEKQDGFIHRTLTLSEENHWTDIVFWKDHHSIEQALKSSEQSEAVLPFLEKIDVQSVKMNLNKPVL